MAADLPNGRRELRGKYRFITTEKLKIELSGKGEGLGPVVYELALAGDKMTLTDLMVRRRSIGKHNDLAEECSQQRGA